MTGASRILASEQQLSAGRSETYKYAFSEAKSDNFVVGKNSSVPDAAVDCLGPPSSKQPFQVFTRILSVADVSHTE